MVIGVMLLIGVLAVGVVAALALRSVTLGEARTEARLREPGTHKLIYVVPEGQDPAVLISALASAGYASVAEMEGGIEHLLVACEESDRSQVRDIIEHVTRTSFSGGEMHVAHVTFDDER